MDLSSTEFIKLNQASIKGPELPFTISCHSMIQYDENSIYIIGGLQDDSFSNQTWIIDPSNNFNLREGPPLNERRYYHSCGKMEINGKVILVVAGGGGGFGGYLDSVELMDPASDQGWISGI